MPPTPQGYGPRVPSRQTATFSHSARATLTQRRRSKLRSQRPAGDLSCVPSDPSGPGTACEPAACDAPPQPQPHARRPSGKRGKAGRETTEQTKAHFLLPDTETPPNDPPPGPETNNGSCITTLSDHEFLLKEGLGRGRQGSGPTRVGPEGHWSTTRQETRAAPAVQAPAPTTTKV